MWRVATLSKGQMFLYKNDPIANQDFKIFVCFLPLCWMGSYTGMEAWLELHRWIDKRTCELANKTWEGATREKDDIALREGYLEVERVKKRLNEIS